MGARPPRRGVGRAPGKVILLGEHAVVYGQPALATPTGGHEVGVEVEEIPGASRKDHLELEGIFEGGDPSQLLTIIGELREALNVPQGGLRIRISSTLPPQAGMGSSAALAVALARALGDWMGRALSPEEASTLAFGAETRFHGRASGVDNTTAAWSCPLLFRPGSPPELLKTGPSWRFFLVHSGVASSTREAVAAVARRREADPSGMEAIFREVGHLVLAGRSALEREDRPGFASIMAENQECLRHLGVSHPAVEEIIGRAKRLGSAAKVTGGGCGGMVLLLPEKEEALFLNEFPGAIPVSMGISPISNSTVSDVVSSPPLPESVT